MLLGRREGYAIESSLFTEIQSQNDALIDEYFGLAFLQVLAGSDDFHDFSPQ
jgi:hypothetical protein